MNAAILSAPLPNSTENTTTVILGDGAPSAPGRSAAAGSRTGTAHTSPTTPAAPSAPVSAPRPAAPADDAGRTFALTSFVLGIASIVAGWTFFAPIVGLVLGAVALRRGTSERTLALWGVWLNGALLALSVLAAVAFAIAIGFGLVVLPFVA
ncbi:MAG: DUF4190 domain-containing protein [Leucobacter sp.]